MAQTKLNMTLLLRRDDFTAESKKDYVLLAGEPGYCTATKKFKVGDGSTTWEKLPLANEGLDPSYKKIQEAIAAVETATNVFVDTVAQNANGVITITTKAVDFSGVKGEIEAGYKKIQTALLKNESIKNTFVDTIAQDEQGVITVTFKAVDFSDYYSKEDIEGKNFKTQQSVVNETGDTLKTVTAVTQNENGVIDVTFEAIKTGAVAENETGLTTGDTVYDAIELAKSVLKGTKTEGDTTAETIAGAKAYADARKAELVEMIDGVASAGLTRSIVTELPAVENAALNTIYMIKRPAGLDEKDIYDEYIGIDTNGDKKVDEFELLGNTELDLSNYYTKTQTDDLIKALEVTDISGFGAGKTLATLTETNGKIAATFQDIAITMSQVTGLNTALNNKLDSDTFDGYYVEHAEDYKNDDIDRMLNNKLDSTGIENNNGKLIVGDTDAYYTEITDAGVYVCDLGGMVDDDFASLTRNKLVFYNQGTESETTYTKNYIQHKAETDAETYTLTFPEKTGTLALTSDVKAVEDKVDAINVGVTKVAAGTDIVVDPEAGIGEVTVHHKEYATGNLTKDPAELESGDAYVFTGLNLSNGHVESGSMKSIKAILEGMEFILDGGTAETETV